MITGHNDDFFVTRGINEKGITFFIQLWFELFDSRTLDTYQYAVSNVYVGLKELDVVIEKTIIGSFTTNDNVECLKAELMRYVKEDPILEIYFKNLQNRLMYHLGNNQKNKDDKGNRATLLKLRGEIRYAVTMLEHGYFDSMLALLKDYIIQNNFVGIQTLSKILTSYLIQLGWTPNGLIGMVKRTFVFNEDFSFEQKWTLFTERLHNDSACYVFIQLKIETNNNNQAESVRTLIRTLGIEIKNYDEIINMFDEIDPLNLPASRDKKYMCFHVEAKDTNAAVQMAVSTMNRRMTLLAFYNQISAWSITDAECFTVFKGSHYITQTKIKDIYKTHTFMDSSNKVFENTLTLFSDVKFEKSNIRESLVGVFNYANISLVSMFLEERFMNLWISIESFMKTGQYSNIISHLKEVLPSVLCKRYLYRIIRNFAEDCERCKVSLGFNQSQVSEHQNSKKKLVSDLLSIITNQPIYSDLLIKCQVNTLLAHRLQEIQKLVVCDKNIFERINRYHETITWHIQRLYRIRNEIAHSALHEDQNIIILIEHLYDYLAVLISEVVYASTEKGFTDINLIFPYLKDNYDVFEVSGFGGLASKDHFNAGIIDYI